MENVRKTEFGSFVQQNLTVLDLLNPARIVVGVVVQGVLHVYNSVQTQMPFRSHKPMLALCCGF